MGPAFALFVLACVNLGYTQACDVLRSPLAYQSEDRCRGQGAILAGMYKSQVGGSGRLRYAVSCVPADQAVALGLGAPGLGAPGEALSAAPAGGP